MLDLPQHARGNAHWVILGGLRYHPGAALTRKMIAIRQPYHF